MTKFLNCSVATWLLRTELIAGNSNDTPLLIVNTSIINLATNESDYINLVKYILQTQSGRHYYNPQPIEKKLTASSA